MEIEQKQIIDYDKKYPYNLKLKNWLPGLKNCQKCSKLVKCRQAIYPGYGSTKSIIMFIGQNPGMVPRNKITGVAFRANRTGEYFLDTLKNHNIPFDEVYTTNVCKCGANNGKRNTEVEEEEIKNCLPYLIKEIEMIQPKIIVTVGSMARNNLPGMKEVDDAIVRHSYHPGFVLRKGEMKGTYKNQWTKISRLYFELLKETKFKQRSLGDY